MKLLVIFVLLAFILGGLIGGEITDRDFSITGAVIGSIGVFVIIFCLGWFFYEQDRKRKKVDVSPEVREIFDRMLGVNREAGQIPQDLMNAITSTGEKLHNNDYIDLSIKVLAEFSSLLTYQIKTAFPEGFQLTDNKNYRYKKTFPYFMTNKEALGYIFGAYDYLSQYFGLLSCGRDKVMASMVSSYNTLWSNPSGKAIFSLSLSLQDDQEFIKGRELGGNEAAFFLQKDKRIMPLGLKRILAKKINQ